jgi:hypothetical protein
MSFFTPSPTYHVPAAYALSTVNDAAAKVANPSSKAIATPNAENLEAITKREEMAIHKCLFYSDKQISRSRQV